MVTTSSADRSVGGSRRRWISHGHWRQRSQGPLRLLLLALVGFTAVRLILAIGFIGSTSLSANPGQFLKAFSYGVSADLATALLLVLPLYLLTGFLARFSSRRWVLALGHGLYILQATALIFSFVAAIFFWNEFDTRFNGIAVYYLLFPREVIGNIQESFNAAQYLPLFALAAAAWWWLSRKAIARSLRTPPTRHARLFRAARIVAVAALAFAVIALLPQHTSANRELDDLARNDLVSLVTAAVTNDTEYVGSYPTIAHEEAMPLLRRMLQQDNTRFLQDGPDGGILRHVDNGDKPRHLNIVMVTEESFGSVFVDSLDNPGKVPISPDLERLAKDGLFFTNIYASGDRTVRGLEATETAFAPIPGISTARRPGAAGMYSLPWLLSKQGYHSGVLYGGLNSFDNMGDFWHGIGFDNNWDQRDIRHEAFSTIWGVSDGDLFTEALRRMDEMTAGGQPALLTLMTVSNHRPYEFPGSDTDWDDRLGRIQNTAHYAQRAFAQFIEQARSKPWFDDTVFIFVADHSVKINGAARVPVHAFRIPMLFYSPKHIAPDRNDTLGAQIDLIPTLMGLLGISYDSPFYGVDLRRVPPGGGRFAIAHNFSIAYGRPGHVVVLEPNLSVEGYRFTVGDPDMPAETPDPETLRQAIAQTQEAHRQFYAHGYHWK